ncbi:MAG: hypothetical protein QOE47_311 [Pyrinomonadaceae bacterium]|nr:hypothetical protein [Pyrinomonadaceae bacterium]MDX6271841.1 hypothetical protein [Acidobacteriota bacterium]
MRRTLLRVSLFMFLTAASFTGSSLWESRSVIAAPLPERARTAPQQAEISKSDLPRNKSAYKVHKFSKQVKLDRAAGEASPFITLRLDGLQPTDYVNLRPTGKSEIEVTAGLMVQKSEKPQTEATEDKRLPESSLEVTTDTIAFTRPQVAGVVVLDVELPSGSQTSAILDGEVILNAALREPISIKGREVGQGAKNTATAVLQSVLPPGLRGKSVPTTATKIAYSDKYFVPFSQLQVRKQVAVDLSSPQVRAGVDINEQGKVVKVTPFNEDSAVLEKALMQWEFAPFIVDGQPVAVTTVISLSAIAH